MALGRDVTITWYGHACVEVRTPGDKVVLFDPWFGNPLSTRAADSVDRCDLLLVTHGHGDHFGESVAIASRLDPAWPCIHEMALWLGRHLSRGSDAVIGFNKGGTVEAAGLRVTMTGANHSSGDWNPSGETTLYLGEPAGFVLELEDGFRLYHAGDTDVFSDMRLIGELHRPDIALLPIGGHYTMGPRGGRPRRRAPRRQARHADPLRDLPDPGRDAGGASDRAGCARARRCRDPCPGTGRLGGLTTREGAASRGQRRRPTPW